MSSGTLYELADGLSDRDKEAAGTLAILLVQWISDAAKHMAATGLIDSDVGVPRAALNIASRAYVEALQSELAIRN